MKNVLLLTAPRPKPDYTPLHFGDNRAPQGLGYVASALESRGHKVKIIDLYTFTWSYRGNVEKPESPWRKHQDKTTGRNWARRERMTGDIDAIEQDSRGGFAQNNSDGTMDVGTNLSREISECDPDVIGMYIHTMSFDTGVELASQLKLDYPHIPLMCGGPHPSVLPETIPECFDYVVVGEGESSVVEVVEGLAQKRILLGSRVGLMDELPWPNLDHFWDLPYNWGLKLYGHEEIYPTVSLNTSRGCPFPCKFCGVQDVSGAKYRFISAERIVEHIKYLKENYGVRGIYFREDNFTVSLKRVEKICDILIEESIDIQWACESRVNKLTPNLIEKMAQAGCVGLYVGVESGSNRMLEIMKKLETREDFEEKFPILSENGISTYTTWIYGAPYETPQDRRDNDSLIEKIKPTTVDAFIYMGIPKSNWYREIDERKDYEFKDKNGFIYPKGYLGFSRELYGLDDPRVHYVERLYEENKVEPVFVPW